MTPVHDRVKRLEKEGIIEKYVSLLNKKKLGKNLTVYCQITLIKQNYDISEGFNQAYFEYARSIECNFVSGNFDYLLKIVFSTMEEYHLFSSKKTFGITPSFFNK